MAPHLEVLLQLFVCSEQLLQLWNLPGARAQQSSELHVVGVATALSPVAERLAPEAPSAHFSEQNLALIRSLSCPRLLAIRDLIAQQLGQCLQKPLKLSVHLKEPTCVNMLSTTLDCADSSPTSKRGDV